VAENFQKVALPYRSYRFGWVFRNEKPGPGRFRQFMQFDADTVGAESVAADAEMCMLAADTLEALGVKRGDYAIKVSNRKLLDGLLEGIGLDVSDGARRLTVLRAVDKLDRLGLQGVSDLLSKGRKDESGDFTKGAELTPAQSMEVINFLEKPVFENRPKSDNATFNAGVQDLLEIQNLCRSAGYDEARIRVDQTVVRGLEYYTGPVFEAELTFEVKGDDGKPVRFGSVGGGGRYDDLVARFTGEKVPATGFSIGVSRLQAALSLIDGQQRQALGPVVVLVMDKGEVARYQKITQDLRNAGIRAEMYLGSSGMKAQMKYADKRNAPCAIIQGSDERAKGEVTIKDLIEGAKAAAAIKDNKEWKAARPAQFSVSEANLIDEVKKLVARHQD
jgi:histidyl-tRNA synthetase